MNNISLSYSMSHSTGKEDDGTDPAEERNRRPLSGARIAEGENNGASSIRIHPQQSNSEELRNHLIDVMQRAIALIGDDAAGEAMNESSAPSLDRDSRGQVIGPVMPSGSGVPFPSTNPALARQQRQLLQEATRVAGAHQEAVPAASEPPSEDFKEQSDNDPCDEERAF